MLKQQAQTQRVVDGSGAPKYYVRIPRLILMKARNPYDLSFYAMIKDFAGEAGSCFINTVELAELTGMSEGKVNEARAFWLETGYIAGELVTTPNGGSVWNLTIKNVWADNNTWATLHPDLDSRIAYREERAAPKKTWQKTCKRCGTDYESAARGRTRLCPDCQALATEEKEQIHNVFARQPRVISMRKTTARSAAGSSTWNYT